MWLTDRVVWAGGMVCHLLDDKRAEVENPMVIAISLAGDETPEVFDLVRFEDPDAAFAARER